MKRLLISTLVVIALLASALSTQAKESVAIVDNMVYTVSGEVFAFPSVNQVTVGGCSCGSWSAVSGYDGFLNMQYRSCTSGSTSYKQYRQTGAAEISLCQISKCYCSPWTAKWGLTVKQCVTVSPSGGETWSLAIWMDPTSPGGTWPTDAQICP